MNRSLKIAITCYPTYGGSGIIATEIGLQMARRGHKVHFITADLPQRFDRYQENVFFHSVEANDYPLLAFPHYDLALASKMVEVATYENLDIFHVHYAVPHATSAYLAGQILGSKARPKIITTLHGTDITLVGNERSYLPVARFSILQSDGVTAPTNFLKNATHDKLNVPTSFPIEVIPNFVDTDKFKPLDQKSSAAIPGCKELSQKPVLTHISNFRQVKRIEDVVDVFALVKKEIDCHLLLVGDGPTRSTIESRVHELNLQSSVCFLGKLEQVEEILKKSDLFILPSKNESFGLAALEAMSCAVPVIASSAEGIPEVVKHGSVGFLSAIGDVADMAKNCLTLLTDPAKYQQFSANARQLALDKYKVDEIIDRYEQYYFKIIR